MYTQRPRFDDAEPWWTFDEECRKANVEFEQAMANAKAARDLVLLTEGTWSARDCIEAAANARYEAKEKSARNARDERLKQARGALFGNLPEAA